MTQPQRRIDPPLHRRATAWDETTLVRVGGIRAPPRRYRWVSRVLALVGLGLIGYVGAKQLEATWAQRWAAERLEETTRAGDDGAAIPALRPGDPVARLAIRRLGIDIVALEGVDPEVLDRGAGHFPGSALPGAPGNASFAGHRDSFFRGLGRVEEGDEVRLDTPSGVHVYRVTGTQIVGPHQVEVVAPIAGRHLTLVTCYPFDWIGPAPKRFIVRAALEASQAAAEAPRETAAGSLARPG